MICLVLNVFKALLIKRNDSVLFSDVVVGHVGNSCLFFEKMLAEGGEEDTIDS